MVKEIYIFGLAWMVSQLKVMAGASMGQLFCYLLNLQKFSPRYESMISFMESWGVNEKNCPTFYEYNETNATEVSNIQYNIPDHPVDIGYKL